MYLSRRCALSSCALIVFGVVVGSLAAADPAKDAKPAAAKAAPAGQPEFKLPPGWTEADMQACMLAATPGEMHKHLAKHVGVWQGKCQMWMPGGESEPMKSDCTYTVTSIMDGRYIKAELVGEMPGMGPFNGLGITGFDNVSQKFVSTWVDNCNTGIVNGTGEISPDGKVMTWTFTVNCPIAKKPAIMRHNEVLTGENTKTLDIFGSDPKSGKEYKAMRIEFTRK
jgi:hypothetical protein